jgi:hypothetical protein
MAYDVIGNVVDSADKELKDVVVSDGIQSVITNNDGYYEIKTNSNRLTYSKNGFVTGSFDLGRYRNPSSINADITLQTSQPQGQTKQRKLNKTAIYIGVSIVLLVGGYFAYRKFKK